MDWDAFFRVWAVIGPLLAAAASAFWARRIQLSDRKHEDAREKDKLDRAEQSQIQEETRQSKSNLQNELKAALANFMASSHELVRKQSDHLSHPTAETQSIASQANDKFTYSGQLVILLGDYDLEYATVALWNATLAIPRNYTEPSDDAYKEKFSTYRNVRAEFNKAAKTYLRSLDHPEP